MPNTGNFAEAIERFVLGFSDDILVHELTSAILEKNEELDREFVMPGWVKISTTLVDKLGFYVPSNDLLAVSTTNVNLYADYNGNVAANNRAGYPIKGSSTVWRLYQVRFNRAAQYKIDTFTDWKVGQRLVAKTIRESYRQAIIPEIDATRYSILASATSTQLGNRVLGTITKDNVVEAIDLADKVLYNNGAGTGVQVLFMSPDTEMSLKQASNFYRTFTIESRDYALGYDSEGVAINTKVKMYNDKVIIKVPDDRFFTDVLLTEDGYTSSATSRPINFILANVDYAFAIRILQSLKAFGPEVVQDYDGWKINYHIWHDLIIPEMKKVAFYAHIKNELLGEYATEVKVDSHEGPAEGQSVIDGIFTEPKGVNFVKVYVKETAFGDIGTTQAGGTLVEVGSPFTPAAASLYVAVTDNAGTILAKSSAAVAFNIKAE